MIDPHAPTTLEDPLAGTPYQVRRLLGSGAFGQVWRAAHRRLGTEVAVKLLHPGLTGDEGVLDRVRLEAQAAARLDSPHVVKVTDLAETPGGQIYVVMELLAGRSLDAELKERGRFGAEEAIGIAVQLLAGLEAVHGLGLVHRDVKPANVFLCDSKDGGKPLVKLLDFGLTKVVSEGKAPVAPLAIPTVAGMVVGTPRYLSPEQICGRPVDGRADQYAAALVLYKMLCGEGPFDAHGRAELLVAHMSEAPAPPSAHVPELSADLDAVVLKALAKKPAARFPTAQAFGEALARVTPRRAAAPQAAETVVLPRHEAEPLGEGVATTVPMDTEPLPEEGAAAAGELACERRVVEVDARTSEGHGDGGEHRTRQLAARLGRRRKHAAVDETKHEMRSESHESSGPCCRVGTCQSGWRCFTRGATDETGAR